MLRYNDLDRLLAIYHHQKNLLHHNPKCSTQSESTIITILDVYASMIQY